MKQDIGSDVAQSPAQGELGQKHVGDKLHMR